MPKRLRSIVLFVTAAAGASSPAHAENLLVNGSFDQWRTAITDYVVLSEGSTAMAGWTVTGTSVDLVGGGWQQADGLYSLDLDGTPGPGGVSQTFQTQPGAWYALEFLLAGNPQCSAGVKSMRVDAAGGSRTFTFDVSGTSFGSMGWESQSWCFQAIAEFTTISFISLSSAGSFCGPALDGVVVELSSPPLPGDLDCDGFVNASDLAVLLGAWGDCGTCAGCRSDLDGDCATTAADLALLLGSWTG
jgi:choice-of-anchor C domain-containing protein